MGECEHIAGVWGILLDVTGFSGQYLLLALLGKLGKCSRFSAAQVWLRNKSLLKCQRFCPLA